MAFAAASLLSRGWLAGGVGWRNRPSNGGEPQNPRLTSVGGYCTTLAWGDFKSKAYVNSQISFHVCVGGEIRESPRSASVGAERGRSHCSLLSLLAENRPFAVFPLAGEIRERPYSASGWAERGRLSLLTPLSSLFTPLSLLAENRPFAVFPLAGEIAKARVPQASGRSAGVSHCSLLSLLSSKGILVPKTARNFALFPLDRRYM